MSQKILFIDRDGTLIKEPKNDFQVDSLEKLYFEKDAIPVLLKLKNFGFKFVMVSNQDGLGTHSFPQKTFQNPHEKMLDILQSCGIEFQDIFICPHFEHENCTCRKPKTGLLEEYIKHQLYNKEQSFVIGDRDSDINLASNLGIRGLKYGILTWKDIENEILSSFRSANYERTTKETKIRVKVCLNGGKIDIHTGIDFFDHMLEQIAIHANIGLEIFCKGDLEIDEHHSVEDVALALGTCIKKALGDKIGIARYGFCLPMDECLASCAIDFCNRPHLIYKAKFKKSHLGALSTEMIEHFFYSLSYTMGVSLHLKVKGKNEHHKAEGLFKAFAKALKMAIKIESEKLASSKGII
ncbi:bifunctional histidinol-phosphatase/imidazoleglycerol-phosphate dehydratase HisB [Campylobacter hepaticus]|uniref:bifunctional histidinol-phosphatase/imidazoleglycerol-phosphate dehydratase HisB n=1 Tax=Campylobacter hepaticus TaxID=1813019 RepID=UPI0018C8F10F|nr:bifunctional histidinol-phosphatase/imidazoleglycerol-phosphate dehydratase HisB [Campylobacter hepaticus]MCZ0772912.1 bifunctional histidinol-phosphatase/imidazoleglycerol-phosphate dehydratase HisB [Campylobacter hepaticus]MCZ0774381.1 bifunctional histidinol-phosphatase/imidazoleglycerol-phosphate dehydratase HisB [Campylobacter hepaticus]MCZ0775633.1 bifunctional histidinol-phosphatase/imidazoleglycerol-phosphate dehydratase HisB [Campylobacter hepaticus]QPM43820.1 bifunctional histidino